MWEGFKFEIKRSYDFRVDGDFPTERIPLHWVDGEHFREDDMFNSGECKFDDKPSCPFEDGLYKVRAPEKSLNAVDDSSISGKFLLNSSL